MDVIENDETAIDEKIEKIHYNGFSEVPNVNNNNKLITSEKNSIDSNDEDRENNHSEVLTLLQLCKKFHLKGIENIDNSTNIDLENKNEEKIAALQSYLLKLEEQNDVLASTMIELEKEAEKRVKQMEKRLKSSARTTMEAVINIHEWEREMRRLVQEKLSMESLVNDIQKHLSSLKVENSFLRDQNCNLHHDIQALLHVIHHARSTGHWEMNCITFCEVTPEQIFGPVQSISQMYPTESPQSELQYQRERKISNSDVSSQHTSCSSHSIPSVSNLLESTNDPDASVVFGSMPFINRDFKHKLHVKDKRIAYLESRVSELQHELSVKEAECECHLWKMEILMQHNQNGEQAFNGTSASTDVPVQKCISLPDIGNIYSYKNVLRRPHSCKTFGYQPSLCLKPPRKKNICKKKPCCMKTEEKSQSRLCKCKNNRHDPIENNKALSEPHLFMFGDDVYVYRPCEPVKKTSNVALSSYQHSLPPCQSIDLKFPVSDSNVKICDWDLAHKSSMSYSMQESPYHKVLASSSCSSNDSVADDNSENILSNSVSSINIPNNVFSSSHCECFSYHGENDFNSFHDSKNSDKDSKLVSCSVQTHESSVKISIGLQADLPQNDTEELMWNGNLFELDLSQLRRTVQNLKDSVLKAEDKAEAKGILIEQLQGHLTSAVKEVELKDKALSNVEKKLDLSRSECILLKDRISSLCSRIEQNLKDSEDLKMLHDNLELKLAAKEARINELTEEQKMLQNQKRALMTQLDAQGDMYETVKNELDALRLKTDEYVLQIELQNQTIKNLQEAVVKSKRASDVLPKNETTATGNSNYQNDAKHTSRSSIVDI